MILMYNLTHLSPIHDTSINEERCTPKKLACHHSETHIFEENTSLYPKELSDEHVGAHKEGAEIRATPASTQHFAITGSLSIL